MRTKVRRWLLCFFLKVPIVHPSSLSPHRQKIIDDDLVFYGIQAPKETFERYKYLLKVSDACNWSSHQNTVPLSTRWDTEDAAARPALRHKTPHMIRIQVSIFTAALSLRLWGWKTVKHSPGRASREPKIAPSDLVCQFNICVLFT